ncbi:MAG: DNA methylase N-4 [Candidatus Staskawiczbacteria bacterium RIFOXYB2_FULL_32_9]|uniref:DNA methylase N-4 n=1 Tax=Candidatus Staskawiczbacteria bacterium RIFOXYD1_FULL_32_13 TaxID=1802234 RepID=A0A1G2JPL6_9BACT|nr:MAG: DNA methylase N-4 [Candidatus Staskawiczbacteria bacterium RIFOXYA2_FULL_32_7]OGZ80247.1 MAG: DNA methylase N-4 [Candidatus Staskawiczbacteria bacterium RIFOXYB1_FULL_32_11]OGZ84003.1 MAG: DNA methylase N-4 [Candidatus Staskawiczbacteria bacterium RIFOXYB2_FULL_32_9]OGZ87104.1 MAG: DNA methylase N-4 [Candidatus Staskawiczbacteria bacterium RIFOXYC2_FULL_32_10]OGZ88230.1 MAG: DNA methylase N-4 [Candidatus Staskawiczbacteria bacterium RIFOXYD1_FULL_32_13]
MNNKKQKLELTWIGKDEELKLEPRILIEDPKKSYGDPKSENMLIHGDNLLALKALEQDFTGRIKCIYIDPPYNTGSAFEHYDDNLEHSTWLSLMRPRLEILRNLLDKNDGSIWISIDDDESHYLKVLCDEVFGRSNFVANVIWEKKFSPQNDAKWLSDSHDHILVYAYNKTYWHPFLLPRTEEMDSRYLNPDKDQRGVWTSSDLTVKRITEKDIYPIKSPSGKEFMPTSGRSWGVSKEKMKELIKENRIWFGENGTNMPRLKRFLTEVQDGIVPKTLWYRTEVGDNQEAKREINILFSDDPFDTPKPERLIKRILDLGTKPGDWVLDSFLGSGTTSAVAHKMGRKHIGVEFGEHADTHCLPRLKKVVDGKDGLALSETLGWKGGGGFKFYNLAPSLLTKDSFGNFVIDKSYNANMLASAMCKHEGFKYLPDENFYWKQGKSTETDYIFTTTNFITAEQLDAIHSEMKEGESLLVCAKAFAPECENHFSNITVKKIPQMILGRCEFSKDNYDLNIIKATEAEAEEANEE